ncbi:hypothetical protein CEXT_247341, partial [Caerostris extrusa]
MHVTSENRDCSKRHISGIESRTVIAQVHKLYVTSESSTTAVEAHKWIQQSRTVICMQEKSQIV